MSQSKSLAKVVGDLGNIDEFKVTDEFLQIVNQEPPKNHVLNHPLTAGVKYIPISVIETMLTKLFQHWNIEILREGQILNSVYVTVRLHYRHPITQKMEYQDGVGAVQIQVEKGKDASELKAIKPNAIMLALPSAKSFAIKDAAEHIGKVFGRDMNRKDTLAFNSSYSESNISPTNQLITVDQIRELQRLSTEYSGMSSEKAADWFHEIIGMQYSQVKKFEYDYVVQKLEQERMV